MGMSAPGGTASFSTCGAVPGPDDLKAPPPTPLGFALERPLRILPTAMSLQALGHAGM